MDLLRRGQTLCNGIKVGKKLFSRVYQIYQASNNNIVLAVTEEFYQYWIEKGYALKETFIKENECYCLLSNESYILASVDSAPLISSSMTLNSFIEAFTKAKEITKDFHFSGSIFVEEYSCLLPMIDIDAISNDIALGRFFSGGIYCSTNDSKLLSRYSCVPIDELAEALKKVIESPTAKNITSTYTERDKPKTCLKSETFELPGRPELTLFFNEQIIDVINNLDKYERMGIHFPGATVLYGPPGSGKTYAIDKLSDFLGWPRYDIDASTIASPYIHETSRKINELFSKAIKEAPSIIVIDEMDAFLSERNSSGGNLYHIEEISEFLKSIPTAIENHVLIFAMTNKIEFIDKAILRRGRFDNVIEVPMANAKEIEEALKAICAKLPMASNVNFAFIAEKLDSHPLSDIAFIVKKAGEFAIKNDRELIDNECLSFAMTCLPEEEKKPQIGFHE